MSAISEPQPASARRRNAMFRHLAIFALVALALSSTAAPLVYSTPAAACNAYCE
jgi:hypothetical protein